HRGTRTLTLAQRVDRHLLVGGDDVRGQEDEQVGLRAPVVVPAEEVAEDRDAAEPGNRPCVGADRVGEEPTDHDRLPVARGHRRALGADGGGRADVVRVAHADGRGQVDVGDLLEELEAHEVVGGDLRRHAKRDADVVALDGGEQVGEVARAGGAAGDERDVPPYHDLRLLVVGGDDVGGGEDIHVAV